MKTDRHYKVSEDDSLFTPYSNRYEIKFLTRSTELNEIAERLSGFIGLDTLINSGSGYYVHSIYFDSRDYRFLREKWEGELVRIKPRIRWYTRLENGNVDNIYLELKGRHNHVVLKRRMHISRDMAFGILEDPQAINDNQEQVSSVLSEFCYFAHRFHLRPVVRVLYHRRPYKGLVHPNLRVTFDRALRWSPSTSLDADCDDFRYSLPVTNSVIELKYTSTISRFLLRQLNALGLVQQTYSKYAESMERLLTDHGAR